MMRPFITIERQAQQAIDFYQSVFPSFKLLSLKHHAEPHDDLIMRAVFSVQNQEVIISDSFVTHDWRITPGISFLIDLESKEELLTFADSLSRQGKIYMPVGNYGFSTLFAWVEDQFGVSWQLNVN